MSAAADILDSLVQEGGLSVADLCRETGRDALEVAGALSSLVASGAVRARRLGGVEVYAITMEGQRQLRQALAAGGGT